MSAEGPDREQFTLERVGTVLEACPSVEVGLALDQTSTPARCRYVSITDHPRDRPTRAWNYGPLGLYEVMAPGAEVAQWLADMRGTIRLARASEIEFDLEGLGDSTWSERHPAFSGSDPQALPVPYRRFSLGSRVALNSSMSERGWLVAPDAPAFPDPDAALVAFFFDEWAPGASVPHEALIARISTPGPRIGSVRFSGGEVLVSIDDVPEGSRRVPLRLDLAMGDRRFDAQIWRPPWSATLPIPADPGASHWWLVLSEGHRWCDRRDLRNLNRDGAAILIEDDEVVADEQVAVWMNIGECNVLEFKRELPAPRQNARFCRTVAAFANGRGGTLVFGIDPDEATVAPLAESFEEARDRISNIVEGNLTELPPIEITALTTEAGLVVAVDVGAGASPPYGVDKACPIFYIRANASTIPATAEQVRRLVRSAYPQPQSRFPY